MTARIIDVEQVSAEWFAARLGIVTASKFKDVMAKGRAKGTHGAGRRTYMLQLLAERLSGQVAPNWTNEHTARGHEDEPKARDAYQFETGNEVNQVGFIMDDEIGVTFGAFMTVFRSKYSDFLSCIFNSQVFEAQSSAFMTSTINQLTISTLNNTRKSLRE